MELLDKGTVRKLIERRGGPCVSIYMPTHRTGADIQQDPIRLKNLLREAEERLTSDGMRGAEAQQVLEPAEKLLGDEDFWQHQSDGLAVFLASDEFRFYRLPFEFSELAVVTDRFHVKPLLPLLSGDGQFYILALSKNQVRLLLGTRQSVGEVDLENVPTSFAEALGREEREKQIQFHTVARRAAAIFHGHGGGGVDDATHKKDLQRYFKQVDKGLHDLLREKKEPLVLAGVEYLLPIYREANTYPHLLDEWIAGNPDGLSARELHAQAWEILQPHFSRAQEQAASQYREMAGTDRASDDLRRIVPASYQGRIESLFVGVGVQRWGKYDVDSDEVVLHDERQSGDEDLLDFAAVQTLVHAGDVYAVPPDDVPHVDSSDGPAAAVFRY